MKHSAGDAWPEFLQEATVPPLAEALLQESELDVTHVFEARISAGLVLSLMASFSRVVKHRCLAVGHLCSD